MKKPRGVLIAGNWKMNHGPTETDRFFSQLRTLESSALSSRTRQALVAGDLSGWIIPPSLSLSAANAAKGALPFPLTVAAQNAHWQRSGAFTGEISGPMLTEIGIHAVLVGHSERRRFFGETDETAKKRAESLLDQNFSVIFCVGETRAEREAGRTQEVLKCQIREGIPATATKQLIVAYEPVWAIGTGLSATVEQAEEAHQLIRDLLIEQLGGDAARRTPILYGGSVTPDNAPALLASETIDGALVGGASLKPEGFLALLEAGGKALG